MEPNKKAPSFSELPPRSISLPENFNDYKAAIASFRALSNVENDPQLNYELVAGRTEQTNKKNNFR